MLIALLAVLAATCQPFDGLQSTRIAREGDSVTEYFPGAYRVTACDAQGRPRRAMTMARIRTPTGARPFVPIAEETPAAEIHLLYGDPAEPVWAKAWLEHGSEAVRRALAPADPIPPDLDPRAVSRDDSCRNGSYTPTNRWSRRSYGYFANERRMSRAFRVAITAGHHAWDQTRNDCGYGDQRNISSAYRGHYAGTIHSYADNRSMVDFGSLRGRCGDATTLACAWTFKFASLGGLIGESDQRYGTGWPWSTSRAPLRYDVASVAAHETGHSIGLGHTTSSPFMTMHHQICAGCTRARTLARGDILGLRALYPSAP